MSTLSVMGTTIQMTSGQIDETTSIESSTLDATINTEIETSSSMMNVVGSTTLVIAMPATTQPSDDNSALIGGIVGGVIALMIVVGVIAFIVMRNRKAKVTQQSTNDGHSLSSQNTNNSNYDRVRVSPPNSNEYGDVNDVRANPNL
jgi:hypothetical protein